MSILGSTADDVAPPLEAVLEKWHEMHRTWQAVLVMAVSNGDRRLEARAESGIERCEAAFERLRHALSPATLH